MKKILLTSFQTWMPHQKSNSSDDLLASIQVETFRDLELIFLRGLPVETGKASQAAIALLQEISCDRVVCCGMAESRQVLTVESNARRGKECLKTAIDLPALTSQLKNTQISHDAGQFVCEGLYFEILDYLMRSPSCLGLFVHVPILTSENESEILEDFKKLLSLI
ncbi:MAG: peptidase C15 [Cyanobacteria bacterium P01_E01_bin.42]